MSTFALKCRCCGQLDGFKDKEKDARFMRIFDSRAKAEVEALRAAAEMPAEKKLHWAGDDGQVFDVVPIAIIELDAEGQAVRFNR